MPLSTLQQIEIDQSSSYDDSLTPDESGSSLENDLNKLRSQVLDVLGGDSSNWYDTPTSDLSVLKGKAAVADKTIVYRGQILQDITVTAAQNYEALGASEFPSLNIAIGAAAIGGIASQLSGAIGSHDLAEIAGVNAINPKNLCRVRDASTGDPILSNGKEIMALLQVGIAATDGNAFAATGNDQAQLSFIRENATADDLEACPAGDIAGKTINYTYAARVTLANANEQVFDTHSAFTDQSAAADVSLDNAIDGQSGAATQTQSIDVKITDTYEWQFSDSAGAAIATVKAASGGDVFEVGDAANAAAFIAHGTGNFHDGLSADSDGQTINIGVTAGRIDSTSLELESTTGDLNLDSAAELKFADSRQTTGLPLTDASNTSLSGSPASLFAAINVAATSGIDSRSDANTTQAITPSTEVIVGPSGNATQTLSADLGDYTSKNFVTQVMIWISGRYMRPGADGSANNDVFPATHADDISAGGFFCERAVKTSANIMMIIL